MKPALSLQAWWSFIGIAMILFVIAASLLRVSGPVDVPGIDKFHHFLAYGSMMYWWGMVKPAARFKWAGALIVMGAGLELAQSLLRYRSMEWADMAFNAGGVVIAVVLLMTPASGLLSWLDHQLGNRIHPGSS